MVFFNTTKNYELFRNNDLLKLISTLSFSILTGLGSIIIFPLSFTPIPITMQTLFVLLSGFFLGRYYGVLSQLLYIALGVSGIPWFSGGKFGLSVLIGPTGGYLIGFVFSSFLVGWITDISKETRKSFVLFTSSILGSVIIYVFGILGLLFSNIDFWTSLELGFFPFVPGDIIKIMIAFILALMITPKSDLSIDTGMNQGKRNILYLLVIALSLGMFSLFFGYLFSNGNNIPLYLPWVSLITSLSILPALLLISNKMKI